MERVGATRRSGFMTCLSLLVQAAVCLCVLTTTASAQADCPSMDLGIAIPTPSNSDDWNSLKQGIVGVLNNLDIGGILNKVQVGVVAYRGTSATRFILGQYTTKSDIINAVSNMAQISDSGSALVSAMQSIASLQFNTNKRYKIQGVALVFLDDTLSNATAAKAASQALLDAGYQTLSVGLTSSVTTNDLQVISYQAPNVTSYLRYSSYSEFSSHVSDVANMLCAARPKVCPKQAEIGLILDQSTSIVVGDYDNWDVNVLGFVKAIINSFPISQSLTRVGIVSFSSYAWLAFGLDRFNNAQDMIAEVNSWKQNMRGGETNTAQAFRLARTQLFNNARQGIKKVVILVTDGKSNREADQTLPEANLTKAQNAEVFCIGITNQVNNDELRAIASPPPDTHYFFVSDFSQLSNVLINIVDSDCKIEPTTIAPTTTPVPTTVPVTTTTTPTPTTTTTTTPTTTTTTTTTPTTTTTTTTTPTTTTTTTTTSTTTTPTTTTTTPTTTTTTPTTTTTTPTTTTTTPTTTTTTPTTTTTTPTTTTTTTTTTPAPTTTTPRPEPDPIQPCKTDSDLVFVVCTSGSVDRFFMPAIRSFLNNFTSTLPISGGNRVRLGLVNFGSQPRTEFSIGQFTTVGDIANAINGMLYLGNVTNTAAALAYVRTMFENTSPRTSVDRTVVLILNGNSIDPAATQVEADKLRLAGINVLAVVVGDWLDSNEPRGIVSYTGYTGYTTNGTLFSVLNYPSLGVIANQLRDSVCRNVDMCETYHPCASGSTCVPIMNYYICTCPPGYGGEKCDNPCPNPGDLIIALDSSGSIGLPNFMLVTSFATQLARSLDLDSALLNRDGGLKGFRVGLLTFSDAVNVFFQLNTYTQATQKDKLLKAIGVRYIEGSTNTAAGLSTASNQMLTPGNGSRSGVPQYIIIITDGMSDNPSQTWMEAISARQKGIGIAAIGVGPSYNYTELRGIVSAPETSNLVAFANFSTLGDPALLDRYSKLLCRTVDPCLSNPCKNGATCRPQLGGYTCGPCPTGFSGFNCERGCTGVLDVLFVVDASGSVQWERMPNVTAFMAAIVADLDVSLTTTRVGAIYFNNVTYTAFALNRYNNRQDVQQAIRAIPFLGGTSNLAAALRAAKAMFTPANGDRTIAQNIVILITDGYPTIEVDNALPAAIELKNSGVLVITVAVSHPAFINFDLVHAMSSQPVARHSFNVTSYTEIVAKSASLVDVTCNAVNECGSTPCQNGGMCYDDYDQYVCYCPSGWAGYSCEFECNQEMDLVFLLDLSGSVEDDLTYETIVEFVRRVVANLDVRNGKVRVGVVTYADTARNEFYLNKYVNDQRGLQNAIEFNHAGGHTNTQAGLAAVLDQFKAQNGDRTGVPNVVVLVSDGYSDAVQDDTNNGAQTLKDNGVIVFSVGLTANPNRGELLSICSDTASEHYVDLPTRTDRFTAADDLAVKLCSTVSK